MTDRKHDSAGPSRDARGSAVKRPASLGDVEALPMHEIVIDPPLATALFRILQETLTNVARHADATQVDVRLAEEGDSFILNVRDNGKGISDDQLTAGSSLGILGMRERAVLLGGQLTIDGAPGDGTTVTVRVPVATPYDLRQKA